MYFLSFSAFSLTKNMIIFSISVSPNKRPHFPLSFVTMSYLLQLRRTKFEFHSFQKNKNFTALIGFEFSISSFTIKKVRSVILVTTHWSCFMVKQWRHWIHHPIRNHGRFIAHRWEWIQKSSPYYSSLYFWLTWFMSIPQE